MAKITKSDDEIKAALITKYNELVQDERIVSYKPANVLINAPLALIQVEGTSQIRLIEYVLGLEPIKLPTNE